MRSSVVCCVLEFSLDYGSHYVWKVGTGNFLTYYYIPFEIAYQTLNSISRLLVFHRN